MVSQSSEFSTPGDIKIMSLSVLFSLILFHVLTDEICFGPKKGCIVQNVNYGLVVSSDYRMLSCSQEASETLKRVSQRANAISTTCNVYNQYYTFKSTVLADSCPECRCYTITLQCISIFYDKSCRFHRKTIFQTQSLRLYQHIHNWKRKKVMFFHKAVFSRSYCSQCSMYCFLARKFSWTSCRLHWWQLNYAAIDVRILF